AVVLRQQRPTLSGGLKPAPSPEALAQQLAELEPRLAEQMLREIEQLGDDDVDAILAHNPYLE
ncbi:MAG TPA: hypothetical protein PKD98_12350, partial [Anaerolineae bacterium]|nr:hypothetical protein [Anaerolineae bacterium]